MDPLDDVALPQLIGRLYDQAPAPQRARLLQPLLAPMGPLGLVAVAAGAFGRFLQRPGPVRLAVGVADTLALTGAQVAELARFVQQRCPEALCGLVAVCSENPALTATATGALLLMALRRLGPVAGPRAADDHPQARPQPR